MPPDPSDTTRLAGGSPLARERDLFATLGEIGPEGATLTEQLRTILRQLGLESVEPRRTAIQEGLLQRQRQASGSPQEILTVFNQQINQIQQQLGQQLQAIGRQGGYALGGQRKRAQGQAVGQALAQYQGLIGQGVLEGQRGLLDLASNIRPLTAAQIPPASSSVSQQPLDLSGVGGGIASLQGLLQRLFPQTGSAAPAIGLSTQGTIQQPPLLSPSVPIGLTPPTAYGPAPGTIAFGA